MELIGRFGFKSGRDINKLEGIPSTKGVTGVPIVTDHAVAYLEAEVMRSMSAETHTLFLAKVVHAEILDDNAEPMTYAFYHQVKRGTAPKTAPTYIKEEPKKEEPKPAASAKWRCTVCGYIYDPAVGDPDGGIQPGTAFEDIPDSWECPVCGAKKSDFEKVS